MLRGDGLVGTPAAAIPKLRRLAEDVGASFHTVVGGEDVPTALLDFARGANATQLVLGTSRRSRLARMFVEGVGSRVAAESGTIDVQATAYIGQSGHFAARLELEHDLHITQRTVFQPLVELSLSGKDDPDRGIGAGLSTGEVGFRVRYEFRRELAPYAGVVWHRKLFGTGDDARAQGKDAGGWHLVAGLRWWL